MLRLRQLTLLLGDLCALSIGLYAAVALRYLAWPGHRLAELIAPMSQLFFASIVINFIIGLYDASRSKNTKGFYQKIALSALVWLGLGVAFFYANPRANVAPKTILLLTALIGFALISAWRFLYNRFLSAALWQTNVVFVGLTPEVSELISLLEAEPQHGYKTVGVIARADETARIPILLPTANSMEKLQSKLSGAPIQLVVLAPQLAGDAALMRELYAHLFREVGVMNLATMYEELMKRIPPFTFSEGWFIANLKEHYKKIYDRVRILADYTAALGIGAAFVITFPFIALAIKVTSSGPLFFRQTRISRLGKLFTMYKYRTMKTLNADGSAETQGPQYAVRQDARVTPIGKLLRKTRLDELPQFFNILKGDMAIIGPRPERPEFVAELTQKMPYYALRHLIKPGITGWAQVHQAYYGTIEENLRKLEYDLFYIKNRGPLLDLSILLRTVNILARMIGR